LLLRGRRSKLQRRHPASRREEPHRVAQSVSQKPGLPLFISWKRIVTFPQIISYPPKNSKTKQKAKTNFFFIQLRNKISGSSCSGTSDALKTHHHLELQHKQLNQLQEELRENQVKYYICLLGKLSNRD
jgi:hypothetical protein